ncbi:MAG TPA: type II CAAX endopeptidase family protein [Anaerolineaceae bacterium]|nr:type II CAAX endopeptidase family protein [Anaerolineaceae bacterium]
MNASHPTQPLRPQWRQVAVFLGLTFAISWGIDGLLALTAGYGANSATATLLQMQMLVPAAVAIALQQFAFRDNPLFVRNAIGRARWFLHFYLLFCLIFLVLAVLSALTGQAVYNQVASLMAYAGLLVVVVLRLLARDRSFAVSGLAFGKFRWWLLHGGLVIAYYGLLTVLNAVFHLGQPADWGLIAFSLGLPISPLAAAALIAFQTILVGPILGLLMGFGEEYGWRSYLQGELFKLGRIRGVLLLGVIWGIWHWPVIWMGHNYPGYPVLGSLLMTLYTIFLAIFLGWVMLKTGSIWLIAFLHAINNQVAAFFMGFVYPINDPVYSFGVGLYTLVVAVPLAWLILRDPVWREQPAPVLPLTELTGQPQA